MATMPPQPPPPQPGQDPRDYARQQKDYYRAWKDQQKDQWRANRDQWKVQRDQWRAQQGYWYGRRRSIVGPIVLVAIGVIFLLIHTGHMEGFRVWEWFGRYWPVILIAAGIGRLIEWYMDRDRPYAPRSSGFVGLMILVIILGIVATSTNRWGMNHFGDNFDDDPDLSFMHGTEHDFEGVKDFTLPVGSSLNVVSQNRGDISILSGTDNQVHVVLHKKVYEVDNNKANKLSEGFDPFFTTSGSVATLRLGANNDIRANMEITVPASIPVSVDMQHGDLTITGRQGNVTALTHHSDMRFTDVTGNLNVHGDHGDVNISTVHGDVLMNGTFGDLVVSGITGHLAMDGDFPGDINLRTIDGPFHFHSSRTDMDAARIVDQLTMDDGDLHASYIAGPFRLKTRDFDVDLSNVSGDVNVTNSKGSVEITAARPLGSIVVDNHQGSVRVTLPQDAGFQLDAEANNGEVSNDFGVGNTSSGDRNVTRGTVGNGALKVSLNSNEGDISIHRTSDAATLPPPGTALPAGSQSSDTNPGPHKFSVPRIPKVPSPPKVPAIPSAPAPGIVNQ